MNEAMAHGLPMIAQALATAGYWKYLFIMLGALLSGSIVAVTSGFLLHVHAFKLPLLFAAIIAGDFLADLLWYAVGRWFAAPVLARRGSFMRIDAERLERLRARFHEHHALILVGSKMIMGFGMAMAMVGAGMVKLRFRSFLLWNILGEFAAVTALLALGYLLGNAYAVIAAELKIVFILAAAALMIATFYFSSLHLRRRAIE